MSRPDDSITPQFGQPAGWPRPQPHGAVPRDPATGRPLPPASPQADAWQGGQGYHYPGQATPEASQHYAPSPQPQYQPVQAQATPRTQPAPMPQGYVSEHYQPPRQQAQQPAAPQGWPAPANQQHYAQPAAGGEAHWPGERLPYQNIANGEARGYEPGAYAPPPSQQYAPDAAHGQYAPAGYNDAQAGYGQHPQQNGYQDPAYAQQYANHEQGYDPHTGQPYAHADQYQQGYGQAGGALDAGQPIAGNEAGYEDDYVDEPPRKRRGLLVVGALVCAVAVGGGLAFVYKTFGPRDKRIGAPPVVAKVNAPAKVAPADPQGKQFDNANKKVLSRLDEQGGGTTSTAASGPPPMVPGMIVSMPPTAGQAAAAPADAGAPSTRSVQTVPIGRDGNPVGGQAAVVTPRGLPGVQIDNSLNQPPPMRGGMSTAETPQPAPKPQAQRFAAAPPPPPPAAAEASDTAAAPPAQKPRVTIPKAPKAAAAAPGATGSTGSAGYVAVLSSQKDRAAALRIYADLAQKYPDQLGSRQPEVQEANLGDKGVWQRLVVGPPSSQQSAKELCSQLKAAGYAADCWAKQY